MALNYEYQAGELRILAYHTEKKRGWFNIKKIVLSVMETLRKMAFGVFGIDMKLIVSKFQFSIEKKYPKQYIPLQGSV